MSTVIKKTIKAFIETELNTHSSDRFLDLDFCLDSNDCEEITDDEIHVFQINSNNNWVEKDDDLCADDCPEVVNEKLIVALNTKLIEWCKEDLIDNIQDLVKNNDIETLIEFSEQ